MGTGEGVYDRVEHNIQNYQHGNKRISSIQISAWAERVQPKTCKKISVRVCNGAKQYPGI
jgi:hypothetical protein